MLSLIFFYDMITANNKQQRVAYLPGFKYNAGLTGVTGINETAASAAFGRQKEEKHEKDNVLCINSDLSACRCGLRRRSKKSRGARRSEGRRGKSAEGGHKRTLHAH